MASRRPSAGYALPCGHAYRRGGYRLTPALPGLRAPAPGKRTPKPRALSGRGGMLGSGEQTYKVACKQWWGVVPSWCGQVG
jgi:hypothetical protein